MLVPVYDIKNCGPRHRFVANGKLVHNSDSVNLQNLPARGANAGKIKKAILPPEDYVFIDCDSSQIEARCLAWTAGQDDLVEAFAKKQDVYKKMASSIYAIPESEVQPNQRFVGKATVLGSGYGMGHTKFQIHLKTSGVELPIEECQRIITVYRQSVPNIVTLWKHAQEALLALHQGRSLRFGRDGFFLVEPGKGIRLPNGLHIQYPDLTTREVDGKTEFVYKSKGEWVRIYGPKVIENLTQAVARLVVSEQLLRIRRRYPPVLTVHDAVGVVAPTEQTAEARAYVEECMSWVPSWAPGLPLACESGVGASYGDC
jgi:DNA polymerase I-like protein with 3'-5' exonuclease and polymerase domains